MLWATSVQASVEVVVVAPAERRLILRMAPFEGANPKLPAQKVDILWNSVRVGECAFVKAEGWALKEVSLHVPASVQVKGRNVITFSSRYSVAPIQLEPEKYADKPKDGRDPLAFGLDSLRLLKPGDPTEAPPGTELTPDFERNAGTFSDNTIAQTPGSRICVPFTAPSSGHVRFTLAECAANAAGDIQGKATLRWDTALGPQEKTLVTYPPAQTATSGPVTVDVDGVERGHAEVIFEAASPRGAAPDVSLVWKSPAIEGTAEEQNDAQSAPPTPNDTPRAENVLFILLDACRADSLGCYGYGRDTTPFIDKLARNGVVFERAYSSAPYTIASTWSLYTSLFPYQHGAPMVPRRPSNSLPMLQKSLHTGGIVTGFSCGNPWSFDTGMANGFDEYLPAFERIFAKTPPERTPGGVTPSFDRFHVPPQEGAILLVCALHDPPRTLFAAGAIPQSVYG